MLPRNWSLERIKEEVAWVYENTVAKGVDPDFINSKGHKFYDGLTSEQSFRIRIEIKNENIINAHPKL